MLHLLLPSLGEAVECSGDAEEEVWEAWEGWGWEDQAWEELAWEDQAWEERGWEEWVIWEEEWEPDVVEWEEGEDSGTGSGQEELQALGLDQPLRR